MKLRYCYVEVEETSKIHAGQAKQLGHCNGDSHRFASDRRRQDLMVGYTFESGASRRDGL